MKYLGLRDLAIFQRSHNKLASVTLGLKLQAMIQKFIVFLGGIFGTYLILKGILLGSACIFCLGLIFSFIYFDYVT